MPSPTTGLQIIEDALGLTNAVGTDQTLTADETSDCLRVFNDVIEDWSTQNMAVYGQANQTFNTVAGQKVYTLGSGGNWNTVRPERINDPAYSTIGGATFPCESITQDEYNLIAVKDQPNEYPYRYLFVNDYPLALVTLWPVPNAITALTFSMDRVLTQIASAGAAISFPQGYAKAFKYRMGIELAPLFGKKLTNYPEVVSIARESFANIKRANKKLRVMQYDPAVLGSNSGYVNWRSG